MYNKDKAENPEERHKLPRADAMGDDEDADDELPLPTGLRGDAHYPDTPEQRKVADLTVTCESVKDWLGRGMGGDKIIAYVEPAMEAGVLQDSRAALTNKAILAFMTDSSKSWSEGIDVAPAEAASRNFAAWGFDATLGSLEERGCYPGVDALAP